MQKGRIVFWEVDTQQDFMLPGGKLYVPGAEKIIPNIARLVNVVREGRVLLISSACRHLADDPEFKTFPPHCVRGTPGERIIPQGLADKVHSVPNDGTAKLPDSIFDNQQLVIEKQTLDVFGNPHTETIVNRLGKDTNTWYSVWSSNIAFTWPRKACWIAATKYPLLKTPSKP